MDLLGAYVNTASQIDTLWNIFMTVHIALFIGAYHYRKEIAIQFKCVVAIGYLAFAFMNFRALTIKYTLLRRLTDVMLAADDYRRHPLLIGYLEEFNFADRAATAVVIHSLAAIFLIGYSFSENRVNHVFRGMTGRSYRVWCLCLAGYRVCVAYSRDSIINTKAHCGKLLRHWKIRASWIPLSSGTPKSVIMAPSPQTTTDEATTRPPPAPPPRTAPMSSSGPGP